MVSIGAKSIVLLLSDSTMLEAVPILRIISGHLFCNLTVIPVEDWHNNTNPFVEVVRLVCKYLFNI